jgi:hypothetical protein
LWGWPHPVIVDKQLFLRDGDDLICYGIAKKDGVKQAMPWSRLVSDRGVAHAGIN